MSFIIGLLLTIVSGILNGSFAVPTKKIKRWEWENTWLIYAFLGMIIFPLIITLISIPELLEIYSRVSTYHLLIVFLFGIGWGCGSLLFGLSIRLVGISVGFTIVVGGIAVFGALLPFLVNSQYSVFDKEGISILLSVLLTIIGIFFCGTASKLRDAEINQKEFSENSFRNFKAGLVLSVIAALLSSMLNFAFYFGEPVAKTAHQFLGARSTPFLVNHSIWVLALAAGFIPFVIYCGFLLAKNRTLGNYTRSNTKGNWFHAALMAILWFLCIIFYGLGSQKLGSIGASLGWLILMAVTVIVGNIWGFLTNEWKGTSIKAKKIMIVGISFLIGNVLIIGLPKIFGWWQ